jgi:hypothetical protein
MELGLQKQTLNDLYFYLYRRALHPELFCIYQSSRITQPKYEASIWIVGLSHVVTFARTNGETLTEVTSNEHELLPSRGLVEQIRFRGERNCQTGWLDGMRFIMSSQVENMSEHVFGQFHEELLLTASKRGMFMAMDKWSNGKLAPLTYIDYHARPRELHIDSFHAFPDELAVLKTQSIFEVR